MIPIELRRLRAQLGWTQGQLADHLGVSQPLVSMWESGRRQPEGAALRGLTRLASTQPTQDDTYNKPPREVILSAAMQVLNDEGLNELSLSRLGREVGLSRSGVEHHFPTRQSLVDALLEEYRTHMGEQIDELEALYVKTETPRPRLMAYLKQGEFAPGAELSEGTHRAAMLAYIMGHEQTIDRMSRWYADQLDRVLRTETDPDRRDELEVALLAVDALWFFDLMGLRRDSVERRTRLVDAARRLLGVEDPS